VRVTVVNDKIAVDEQQTPVVRVQAKLIISIRRDIDAAFDVRPEFSQTERMPVIPGVSRERDGFRGERSDQPRVRRSTTGRGESAIHIDSNAFWRGGDGAVRRPGEVAVVGWLDGHTVLVSTDGCTGQSNLVSVDVTQQAAVPLVTGVDVAAARTPLLRFVPTLPAGIQQEVGSGVG
jgi:hypothetical protein